MRTPLRSAAEAGGRPLGLLCLAPCLGAALAGCGDDAAEAAMRMEEVVGVWFECIDDACDSLGDDGFELTADGTMITLRLESGDTDAVEYCEVPFGDYARDGERLVLMPAPDQDSQDEPRTVTFSVDGDRAQLTDERGDVHPYLRVQGDSNGGCVGVL